MNKLVNIDGVEKVCARCGSTSPSPYLVKVADLIYGDVVVDLGCGNGRNTHYLSDKGYKTYAFDMVPSYFDSIGLVLGKEDIPLPDHTVNCVLASYIFMFLSHKETSLVLKQIDKIVAPGGIIIVELYPDKSSYTNTEAKCFHLWRYLLTELAFKQWDVVRKSKNRFIMQKDWK